MGLTRSCPNGVSSQRKMAFAVHQPQRGCDPHIARHPICPNPVGVVSILNLLPRVARASQPWAGGHSPVGAGPHSCPNRASSQSPRLAPRAYLGKMAFAVLAVMASCSSSLQVWRCRHWSTPPVGHQITRAPHVIRGDGVWPGVWPIGPSPATGSIPNRVCGNGLRAPDWPLSVKVSVN